MGVAEILAVLMVIAVCALLMAGYPVALTLGILSHFENLAITLVLPAWAHDVRTVVHAVSIRRSASSGSAS